MSKKHSSPLEVRERKKKRKACQALARRLGLTPIGADAFEALKRDRK